jgi:metal-dependent HD superfamily phosphatase/phosphodiesterase
MKKSGKQLQLEKQIREELKGLSLEIADYIFADEEVQTLQDYANVLSIKRMGFNDHGPVHMRKAALNAIIMFRLLEKAGINFNFVQEGYGQVDDSRIIVLVASLLHDIGMTVSRSNHEFLSVQLTMPIINRILEKFYPRQTQKIMLLRSMIIEAIFGHMATQPITSLEAGLVLVGDGCDMEKGRARIPTLLLAKSQVGDIHKYSASAIQKVVIGKGDNKPIKITVKMSQSAGIFQIEEVLLTKINFSPVKSYIELYASIRDEEVLQYM